MPKSRSKTFAVKASANDEAVLRTDISIKQMLAAQSFGYEFHTDHGDVVAYVQLRALPKDFLMRHKCNEFAGRVRADCL